MACCIVFLFAGIAEAQPRFSIRAASFQPVEGWQRMQLEHSEKMVWVAPTAAVVGSDIEKAQPEIRDTGDRVIRVVFTDAGAKKIRDLTRAQLRKPVALVVDETLIWAPVVQTEVAKESVLTGNLPNGLTEDEVERIMASLR
jgi:preprotein translocase subunit SecD